MKKEVKNQEKSVKIQEKTIHGAPWGARCHMAPCGDVIVRLVPTVHGHLGENVSVGTTIGIVFFHNRGSCGTQHTPNTLLT